MKIKWKKLIISLIIPLAVGGLSAWITQNAMENFRALEKPPLSPPEVVFPIVWTILFALMGVSFYLIKTSGASKKQIDNAKTIYAIQLFVNFFWSLIFFNLKLYLFAFIWLILLWILILSMIRAFKNISNAAAYLQIPYLLWVTFAGYLNIMIYILNK